MKKVYDNFWKKIGIVAALVLAVLISVPQLRVAAQSYLTEIQGAGMIFRSNDPKVRFPGLLTFETLGGFNIAQLQQDGDIEFEGATADAFETTLTITDPTADRTFTIPDGGGTTMLSSLATNATDAANSVTGASNALVFEGATANGFETSMVPTDPTADRTITLPDLGGTIGIGPIVDVILCGDLPNNATAYTSPVSGLASGAIYADGTTANDLSYALAGSGCAAEDNATEGTADEVMFANNTFHVLGMYCVVSGSGSNGVTINLRSATADLTPDVTVTIATATTTAATATATTTAVAAGATFAAKVVSTEDLSAQDYWCNAKIQIVP